MRKEITRKIIALCISVMMLSVTFLSGCGSDSQTKGSSNQVTSSMAKSTEATTQEQKPQVVLKYFTVEHPNWPIANDSPVLAEIAMKTNVKIEFIAVPQNAFEEKTNLTFASGDLPDLMNLNLVKINEYSQKGVFIAMDDNIAKNAPNLSKLLTPDVKVQIIATDKKIYGIPRLNQPRNMSGLLIRKDWLDKLGVKVPETTDEWVDALIAFRDNDPDGNGKKDTIPWVSYAGSSWLMLNVLPAFGLDGYNSANYTNILDGKMVNIATTEAYRKALTWLNMCYKEGLLDKEFAILSSKQWEERMSSNVGGATPSYLGRTDMFNSLARKTTPEYNLIATVPLKGPDGNRGATSYNSVLTGYSVGITKNCTDTEAAIKYLDFLYSDEGTQLTTWGIENLTYNLKDGKKVFSDELMKEPTDLIVKAKYGIMQPMFPRVIDIAEPELTNGQNTNDAIKIYEQFYMEPFPNLVYTDEEQQKIKEISAAIKPIIDQYTDKFIMGEIPLEDWDEFQEQLTKVGVEDFVKIQNDAYIEYLNLLKSVK